MIEIRLYQQKSKARTDGSALIYYVLARESERKYITSKKYVNTKFFANDSGLVLKGDDNSVKLNTHFKRELLQLDDIITALQKEGHEILFDNIEEIFKNNNGDDFIAWAGNELKENTSLVKHKTNTPVPPIRNRE